MCVVCVCVCVHACVHVCVSERERERDRVLKRERGKERATEPLNRTWLANTCTCSCSIKLWVGSIPVLVVMYGFVGEPVFGIS